LKQQKRPGRNFLELHEIHANVPKRLVTAYLKADCNQHELSRRLEVNAFYVNQLLRQGIEPTNPEIRARLFLPRTHRKQAKREPLPEWLQFMKKKIRKMTKETRKALAERLQGN